MPDKVALHRKDKAPIGPEAPSYLIHSIVTSVPSYEVTDCRVKISGFRSVFMVSHKFKDMRLSLLVTPPDPIFDGTLAFSMDLWSLGCTFYSIVGNWSLSFILFGSKDNFVEGMVIVLGPLPRPLWERWVGRRNCHNKWGDSLIKWHAPAVTAAKIGNLGKMEQNEYNEQMCKWST